MSDNLEIMKKTAKQMLAKAMAEHIYNAAQKYNKGLDVSDSEQIEESWEAYSEIGGNAIAELGEELAKRVYIAGLMKLPIESVIKSN